MLDRSRIQALGLDLDGTLYKKTPETEDRENEAVARVIRKHNPDFGTFEATVQYVERQYALLKSRGKVISHALNFSPGTNDDSWMIGARIHELLVQLKKSYTLYLLTSSPDEATLKKLDALALNPNLFARCVCGNTPGAESKSNGTAFRYAADCLGVSPCHHCYVGDREKQDILPARKLSMQTIAVWSEIPTATVWIPHIHGIEQLLKI